MSVVKIALLGFILVAFASGKTTRGPILDKIVSDLLEKNRPKLKDLKIPTQELNVSNPNTNITASLKNGLVQDLDKFVLSALSTSLTPLKITNLTLKFEEVKLTGEYTLNGKVILPNLSGNLTLGGDGEALIILKGVFFTIAADFVRKDGKLQIPPKGLHDFDMSISKSEVNLKNLLGGEETEKIVNGFLSFFIPDIVRDCKKPIFEGVRDPLIKLINDALAQEKAATGKLGKANSIVQ